MSTELATHLVVAWIRAFGCEYTSDVMFKPTATRGPCTFHSGPLLAGAHSLCHQRVRNHLDTKGPERQMRPEVGQRHSRWPDGCGCGAGDPRVLRGVSEAEPNVPGAGHGVNQYS